MLIIKNTHTDPYYNIAAEEYLMRRGIEDIFMMWQNEPSVIVGKYQNIETEVNTPFAHENHIKIARRFSGGGAVYHDLGNVNLTFIERNSKRNFSKYPHLIIDLLKTIGINATQDQRLGLEIGGFKISGSAQYVYKDVSLFHATLLFSSNLMVLKNVLLTSDSMIENRKFVKSVRSPVTNICEHLSTPMQIDDFKQAILNHFTGDSYTFDQKDLDSIEQLKLKQQ